MDPARLVIRVLVAYVVVHVLLRLAGKRFVAQATGFDFVLALIVGDLIDDVFWGEVPVSTFVVAAATLVLAHVASGLAATRSSRASDWLVGAPRLVLRDGQPLRHALRAERVNHDELKSLLRSEGLRPGQWARVRAGFIEGSGELGMLEHGWGRPAQRADRERAMRRRKRS